MTGLKSAELANQIQYAVAAKAMDAAKQEGAAVLKLLQSAMSGFDQQLASANAKTNPNRQLDVYG